MTDDLKERARAFADRWHGRGDENADTQQYWLDLLEHVLHVPDVMGRDVCRFEVRTAAGGYVDVLLPRARILVEQKSLGVSLDRPEPRQGVSKTPARQALDYANALPWSLKPATLITCSFDRFRLYDLDADPLAREPQAEFTLDALPDHAGELAALFDEGRSRPHVERVESVQAGRLVAKLHGVLAGCWPDADEPDAHRALALLTVRLVFCLYADAARLFPAKAFRALVAGSDARHLRGDLADLFDVLDTPAGRRSRNLDPLLASFPYVDGGLFEQRIDPPSMTDGVRDALLAMIDGFDWSHISPVVFGSLMEETLSHDERRQGGMHYTSVENIHKVIDPLFLDGLKRELAAAEAKPSAGGARTKALRAFHDRLAGLRFLDPACGSGNFLTETYLCLRRLENRLLADLRKDGQLALDLGDGFTPIRVSIAAMHGIEINGFACQVARTALWIAEQQALDDTESIIAGLPRLPFTDSARIVEANALRLDWNTVLDGRDCDYVMGNPPFVEQKQKTREQCEDMRLVWGDDYDGYLDYVTGWFRKAADYCVKPEAMFAFVSTNSICQGQPVPALFRPLWRLGWELAWARSSFEWDAQSSDAAGVAVIVTGWTRDPALPRKLAYGAEGVMRLVTHVSPYLTEGPDVLVDKRMRPLSPMLAPAVRGFQPTDGGGLLLKTRDEYETAMADPIATEYVRACIGADELLYGKSRWCLWLVNATPADMQSSPFIRERIERVREFRLHSRKPATREAAKTPWLFQEWSRSAGDRFLVIPQITSETREWFPVGTADKSTIVTNRCYMQPDPDGLQFALYSTRMVRVWLDAVGGHLEKRLVYSNTIVWNNLPLPHLDDAARAGLIAAGRAILDARAAYPDSTLADLYDPKLMPAGLRHAHKKLDKTADMAFGAPQWLKDDDEARLRLLFANYARLTGVSSQAV